MTANHDLSRSQPMKPTSLFSPVMLRYVAALRGHKPKKTGTEFSYGEMNCQDTENLICLAASNPEGRFYGFVAHEQARQSGEAQAAQRGIFNTVFVVGSATQIAERVRSGSTIPPMLDYLCCDESATALSDADRASLYELADKRLNPGGLFVSRYRAYDNEEGALRFLTRELAPEMNDEQKKEFLTELKRLGSRLLSRRADLASRLNDAIVKAAPDAFFASLGEGAAPSRAFDTLVAMGSRGLAYAGDANLTSNYVELVVPVEAQPLVVGCRNHVLYEPIKDLALDRTVRNDIWVRSPFDMSAEPAQLFGGFAYGITMPRNSVPPAIAAQGKAIDLSSPLYTKLIDLMTLLPLGIGDFLSHDSGKGEDPSQIMEALQVLVACGIAAPMRGKLAPTRTGNMTQPRFVGSFNRFVDKTAVGGGDVLLASPIMGCGVAVSAREALVMQALNRAGLSNSVSALLPELRRLAGTAAAQGEATSDEAVKMVRDVVDQALPQWYAYGLLEAA